jgi:ABC-type multidrug transport system fused ATPase/permease subunit
MVDRAMVAGQLRGITEGTAAIASGAALVVGALEVAAGRTTPGVVVAAMTIVGFLVPPLRDLGRVQEYWHNSRVALQKVEQFLKTPSLVTEQRNAPELQLGAGRLEFDSVSLKGSLHEVSAIAEPGKIVALVGPNGAGKSTLLSLAARLIDPDKGKILLDGQDLAKYSLESVRRAIGMAGPDLPLLRGTVDKNLRYRWRDAPVEEITRVRQICGIDAVLAELAEGENTKVAEGGKGLSAGQRQRIGLARAILGNPPVLLLDEVDANLDAQATGVVDRVLAEHKGTVLIITHRKERLAAADVIWYLENGRLVEKGPPEVLLNSDGPTARLFRDSQQKVLSA